ncbi:MAG: hypothetical protein QOI31_1770 [Solirubrobacterales bacterium]|jgi:hypothetical protein|nr:hypothetical protein [Solirubrobacterales bacterium]
MIIVARLAADGSAAGALLLAPVLVSLDSLGTYNPAWGFEMFSRNRKSPPSTEHSAASSARSGWVNALIGAAALIVAIVAFLSTWGGNEDNSTDDLGGGDPGASVDELVVAIKDSGASIEELAGVIKDAAVPPPVVTDSLSELAEQGDVEGGGHVQVNETVSIGGKTFGNGITTWAVSGNEQSDREALIKAKGEYAELYGVVGIDGDGCTDSPARVWVEDDLGAVVWGPVEVDSRSQKRVKANIAGAIDVYLVAESLVTEGGTCDGSADVAWGGIELLPGA